MAKHLPRQNKLTERMSLTEVVATKELLSFDPRRRLQKDSFVESVCKDIFVNGTAPFTGVSFHRKSSSFAAQVRVDGGRRHIGYKKTSRESAGLISAFFKESRPDDSRLKKIAEQIAYWDAGIRPTNGS